MIYLTMLETEADKVIFEKLYEEKRQKMHFVARKILHDETNAEDAVHNGFINLANNFAKYRSKSYDELVRICTIIVKNAAIDIIRENSRRYSFVEGDGFYEDSISDITPDILDKIIEQHDSALLDEALKELEEGERGILYLQYAAGYKPKKIGEMLNMSSAEVRKKTHISRNKLAEILKEKDFL